MDIATVIGLLLGVGLVLTSIMMGEGGLVPFIDIPSMMIVLGGSISAVLINFPLASCLGLFGILKKCFLTKLPASEAVIEQFKEFSTIARKDGLLALESKVESIEDEFTVRGMGMVVGGTTKEEVQAVLECEISYVDERHKLGKKIIDALGAAAPAFGMVGTLIGLVQMLGALDDPSKIGGGMATALLTTLYGAVIANLFCIPLAGKLDARNKEEIMNRELITAGLIALVEGQAPRNLEGRLSAYVSPKARPADAA